MKKPAKAAAITSLQFFSKLKWIDGRPLIDTIEPYRQRLFTLALDTTRTGILAGIFGGTPRPAYNLVLAGRGKKNWKSADLVLAALFCLVARRDSHQGNDGLILANDEAQAGDDLQLAKKLIGINPILAAELEPLAKEIRRRDGKGVLRILPAHDVVGLHGKTAGFVGFDEIHGLKNWDLIEALQPDPTRSDALQWFTSYDTPFNLPGVPLFDMKKVGIAGSDPRMLFSWYSGDLCTDPDFAELEPELRANPSIGSWPEGRGYLDQQRLRLPTHKYRRLHLNLPGAPSGAFLDQAVVMAAVVSGRKALPWRDGVRYRGFVDMSGGSADDAVLCIAHSEGKRIVVDRIERQAGSPPFDPRRAVMRFAGILREYHLSEVTGDGYAGLTFRLDFESCDVAYRVSKRDTTELYEALEPRLNAAEVELLDVAVLTQQLICLIMRGTKIGHPNGDHDDFANACAGAIDLVANSSRTRGRLLAVGVGGDGTNPDSASWNYADGSGYDPFRRDCDTGAAPEVGGGRNLPVENRGDVPGVARLAGLSGHFDSELAKHLAREFGKRSEIQNNKRQLGGH